MFRLDVDGSVSECGRAGKPLHFRNLLIDIMD